MDGNGGLQLGDLTQEKLPLVVVQIDGRVNTLERDWADFLKDWKEEKRWRRNSLYQTALTTLGWAVTIYLAMKGGK